MQQQQLLLVLLELRLWVRPRALMCLGLLWQQLCWLEPGGLPACALPEQLQQVSLGIASGWSLSCALLSWQRHVAEGVCAPIHIL